MKYFLGTLILGLGVLLFFFYRSQQFEATATESGQVVLRGVPASICPEKAWLVIVGENRPTVVDRTITIKDCRQFDVRPYVGAETGNYTLLLKLPNAIAAKAEFAAPLSTNLSLPVRYGDVTADNIIDKLDEQLIIDNLHESSSRYDITGDEKVNIDDVVITRINAGIGSIRPDNKSWSGEVR